MHSYLRAPLASAAGIPSVDGDNDEDGDKVASLDLICLPDIIFLACNASFQEYLLLDLFVDDDEAAFSYCLFAIGEGEVNRDFMKCLDEEVPLSFV